MPKNRRLGDLSSSFSSWAYWVGAVCQAWLLATWHLAERGEVAGQILMIGLSGWAGIFAVTPSIVAWQLHTLMRDSLFDEEKTIHWWRRMAPDHAFFQRFLLYEEICIPAMWKYLRLPFRP